VLDIIPYTPSWRKRWDEFVLQSNNGTIFHLQQFLDYHLERNFPWHHLIFRRKDKIIAVLPASLQGSVLESPLGASYGSFVTNELSFDEALDLVETFAEYCREQGIERALLTPPPFIYQRHISQNLDYALAYSGFAFDKHYISHAIPLNNPHFLETFKATARRYVHKYLREKTLTIEISRDYKSFYPILVKNKERHGVKPTHSLAELQRIQELFPERVVLFLVKRSGKPIAGSLLFACNPQVVLCFYNMLLYEYESYNPIHAVMYEAMRWATERQFSWLDMGVSQDTSAENPMTPATSLIRFKEKFNATGILRSTFYKRFL